MSEAHDAAAAGYPLVYRNLMAIGLLGAVYRVRDEAETVSSAVELTLADPTSFRVCRAIAQGIGGDAQYASETLGRHLDEHPDGQPHTDRGRHRRYRRDANVGRSGDLGFRPAGACERCLGR